MESKDEVYMDNVVDILKTETEVVVNRGLTDNEMFLCLESSGYDFANGFINWILWSKGSEAIRCYIALKMSQRQKKADGRKDSDEKALVEATHILEAVEKKEESQKQEVETAVPVETIQPSSVSTDTNLKIERVPLLGNLFWTGYKILFASDYGFGKSLFSIFLCILGFTQKVIRKACFFTLEDKDGEQAPRYVEMLKNHPATVVSSKTLDKEVQRLESKAEMDAGIDTIFYGNIPELKKWENARNFALKKHGVTKKKIPLRLLAFLGLLQEMIDDGYDFFVVDSLAEIFGNMNQLSRELINAFLEIPLKTGITFLVLHHVNGKETFRGTKDLLSNFDSAYILEEVQEENTKGETLLRIRVEKKRYENEKPLLIQRNRLSKYLAEHKIIEEIVSPTLSIGKNKTFKVMILEYIREAGQKCCSFDDLFQSMKKIRSSTSRDSVQNILRRLREERKVEAVGKPWNLIRAL